MKGGFRTTMGEGGESSHPTITIQKNTTANAKTNFTRDAGNLDLVNVAGTVTITSTLKPWLNMPSIGDRVELTGFTNAENNGIFVLTGVTETTIVFTNASAINETITNYRDLFFILEADQKVYQDTTLTSGTPNYAMVNGGASGTLKALGGSYAYISVMSSLDAECIVKVAGGQFYIPSGASFAHEVKQFTEDVTIDATAATAGTVIVNIS